MNLLIARRVVLVAVVLVTLGTVALARSVALADHASATLNSSRLAGYTVDHPPERALGSLREFVRCMRAHGVWMPAPVGWGGHRGRLLIYLPPRDHATQHAYRACDHYRVLAKTISGPH